jgi:hypothetical protein
MYTVFVNTVTGISGRILNKTLHRFDRAGRVYWKYITLDDMRADREDFIAAINRHGNGGLIKLDVAGEEILTSEEDLEMLVERMDMILNDNEACKTATG